MSDEKHRLDTEKQTDPGRYSPSPRPKMPAATPSTAAVASSSLWPILSYCASSILMTVTNKYVLSGLNFNLNFFLLAVQVCLLLEAGEEYLIDVTRLSYALWLSGRVNLQASSHIVTSTQTRPKNVSRISSPMETSADSSISGFPISLLLIGMIYTGTKALQFLSIPVYTIFKNLTIILIAYGEVLWFGGSVTAMTLFSFGLMVISSVIAAWADIQAALSSYGGASSADASDKISTLNAGYVWMMINCFCTATYVLGMRKRIKLTNFKDFDTMYYNNLLSIPILLVCSLVIEDWSSTNLNLNFPAEQRQGIWMAMIISGLSSVFISYTSAWCVRTTSSTTYSMVGALNKLPIAVSGLIFFDAPVTIPSVSAIGVGFVSGIVYALAKVRQSKGNNNSITEKGGLPRPVTTSASSQSMRDSLKA